MQKNCLVVGFALLISDLTRSRRQSWESRKISGFGAKGLGFRGTIAKDVAVCRGSCLSFAGRAGGGGSPKALGG